MRRRRALFTSRDAWSGGPYELQVELGAGSDQRLVEGAARIFTHPDLAGPYAARDREPAQQQVASPAALVADGWLSLYGVGSLPTGDRVPVTVSAYRASPDFLVENARDQEGTDWLSLRVPLGSLGQVWPEVGSYPFFGTEEEAHAHKGWQERLEAWFVEIARHLHAGVQVRLAVVGFDIDDVGDVWWSWKHDALPAERWDGILLPDGSGGLAWHPPTRRSGHVIG